MVTLKRNGILGYNQFIMLIIALAGTAGGQTSEKASTEELLQNLTHKDAKIRGEAAWALGKSGEERAVDSIDKGSGGQQQQCARVGSPGPGQDRQALH